ncbi:MAG: hypothetical protein HC828_22230 [Blastochloris sp.]|nr:hypothetical protein [Blastochloris sp.]
MKVPVFLVVIIAGVLMLRIAAAALVSFPGIADPNHYYNMGVRLTQGHGFTIDYIWQYNIPPGQIEHPEEHWMPLTAVLAAAPMALLGEGVHKALIPFLLIGAALPLLAYWMGGQLGLETTSRLFAAAGVGVLPELVLASVRTDTVVPFALFTGVAVLLITHGLRTGRIPAFVGAGVCVGLAYLTRNDGLLLLPMLAVTLIVYALARCPVRWRAALIVPAAALVVASPWLARNIALFGSPTTPETSDMFFFTHHDDHYAYGRAFTLETMLAAQTPAEMISKRLFESLAAVNVMVASLDVLLPVAVIGGVALLVAARDRQRLLVAAPALILLLGFFVAYPLLIPYKAQAGSFKKAFIGLLPLIVPLGAYALERALPIGGCVQARW